VSGGPGDCGKAEEDVRLAMEFFFFTSTPQHSAETKLS
jgi:hypothetical protein